LYVHIGLKTQIPASAPIVNDTASMQRFHEGDNKQGRILQCRSTLSQYKGMENGFLLRWLIRLKIDSAAYLVFIPNMTLRMPTRLMTSVSPMDAMNDAVTTISNFGRMPSSHWTTKYAMTTIAG
jgi:hypothetical protein